MTIDNSLIFEYVVNRKILSYISKYPSRVKLETEKNTLKKITA
jgi:hypothetical protein